MRLWLFLLFLQGLRGVGAASPLVHMLAPGFAVTELPVSIPNINNLRFATDGKLFALGYNGKVYVLTDTNRDGVEDKVATFWSESTLSVPVGMALAAEGVYVASKGKVSLLRDTDRDGTGDAEEEVASGWPPTDVASGGVDATAVTLDNEGNLYFGLLTADYSNPYRVKDGKSRYDLNGKRGTIQKWSRTTRTLETVATGVRVPYALAFNRYGDLFLTDQEGETWCPNGNPLDELNHIIPGRNYGFPPRHDEYLPDLVSEPPVVGFGPQHQSTCGFVFNEPSSKQALFGPKWWEGDAFVVGESRGKIWRVRLVKTPFGYVGKETIIARLHMLTTDVTISPRGELYVSCHSGLPDWGTGPNGEGKIFKIGYSALQAPQPVWTWMANPGEVRIAFDRPVDNSITNSLVGCRIEYGEHARAGDRFEVLKPPYRVVKEQETQLRGTLKILGGRLEGKQVLVLQTEPHHMLAMYCISIPGLKAPGASDSGAVIDVDYGWNGVEAAAIRYSPASKLPRPLRTAAEWSRLDSLTEPSASAAWLPHPNSAISREFLGPADSLVRKHATRLESKTDAYQMTFKLNVPADADRVQFMAERPLEVETTLGQLPCKQSGREHIVEVPAGLARERMDVSVYKGAVPITATYTRSNDPIRRPLSFDNFLYAWAPTNRLARTAESLRPVDVAQGDVRTGRELFFSDRLKCGTCHRVRNEGGEIGPDLSNLVHRDAASVLRDIHDPSASINPDYVAYNISLQDDHEIIGFIRSQSGRRIRVVDAAGTESALVPTQVRQMRPSPLSLMPAGLLDGLSEDEVKSLVAFLVTAPAENATARVRPIDKKQSKPVPPKRSKAELAALLKSRDGLSDTNTFKPLEIMLVASAQDHGPGEHDYPAWQTNWARLLANAERVNILKAWKWPSEEQLKRVHILVFYYWNHSWAPERYAQLDAFLARGGGMVILHSSCIADTEPEPLAERIGLSAQPKRSKYRHGELVLRMEGQHEITDGLPPRLKFLDETYWPMIGDTNKVTVLATAEEEGAWWPMLWTFEKGKGRVFGSILGHYSTTFDDPYFRLMVLRGISWAAREPLGRLEKLAIDGVSWAE